MSSPGGQRDPQTPDDVLPPVEPPSASFVVQLFVVPLAIVVIIVMVWLLFNWIAQKGADPESYVKALKRDNDARWQAAHDLAEVLNNPRHAAVRRDPAMAKELAAMLEAELAKPIMTGDERSRQQMIALRVYLVHALARFQVPEALPALVAAGDSSQNSELEVRLAALAALARWRSEFPADEKVDDNAAVELLFEASRDSEPRVRERAAFALGVFDPQRTRDELIRLLEDPYPDVRYNAATALARHGNSQSVPVILEMLDPDQGAALEAEATDSDRETKQALIWLSALEAINSLTVVDQPQLAELREAVKALAAADIPDPIRVRAEGTLQTLAGRSGE